MLPTLERIKQMVTGEVDELDPALEYPDAQDYEPDIFEEALADSENSWVDVEEPLIDLEDPLADATAADKDPSGLEDPLEEVQVIVERRPIAERPLVQLAAVCLLAICAASVLGPHP